LKIGSDVKSLMKKLILGYRLYFSNDVLNSEGRKIFEELARMLVYEHPYYKALIRRVRRNPTLDNVLKVGEIVLGDEIHELLSLAVYGPYKSILGYDYDRDNSCE